MEMSGYQNNYDRFHVLVIGDSYFLAQPKDVQIFLKEGGKMTLEEMVKRAQNYRDAHDMNGNEEFVRDKFKSSKENKNNKHSVD